MKLDGEIVIEYGEIDTTHFGELVRSLENDPIWDQTERTDVYTIHTSTDSVAFIWTPNLYTENVFYVFHNTKLLESELGQEYQRLAEKVLALVPGKILKAGLVRMKPGGRIPIHRDGPHESWQSSHRLHLPVFTEPEVLFCHFGGKHHLRQNILTEINNDAPHWVLHRGTEWRYHLLFDVLPHDYDGAFSIIDHEDLELFNQQRINEAKDIRIDPIGEIREVVHTPLKAQVR